MNSIERAIEALLRSIAILLVAMALGCSAPQVPGKEATFPGIEGAEVLAVVGSREITSEQLRGRILERYYGPRALLGLIREALFVAESERLALRITEEEVASAVDSEMALILGTGADERARSLERLHQQGLTLSDLRREIVAETAAALLIEKVVAAHRNVTENEIREAWRDSWQFRRRRIEHIVFPFASSDEEDLRLARMRADAAGEAIAAGSSFEAAAAGPWSGGGGPEARVGQGWVTPGQLAGSELGDFVFGLETGSVSEPFLEGGFGYHLVRVAEDLPARPYDQVREQLREELKRRPPEAGEVEEIERQIRSRVPVRTPAGVFGGTGTGLESRGEVQRRQG